MVAHALSSKFTSLLLENGEKESQEEDWKTQALKMGPACDENVPQKQVRWI